MAFAVMVVFSATTTRTLSENVCCHFSIVPGHLGCKTKTNYSGIKLV